MMDIYEDDFQEKEATEWTPEEVAEWLSNVRGGELERYAERFIKENVNGDLLLVLNKRELNKKYRMKKDEIEVFFEELEKITDEIEGSEFSMYEDSPEDLATSMLEKEVELLENVPMPDDHDDYWSFSQFREHYPDLPKVIIVKIFCLLERERSGVISIEELRRFFQACSDEPGMLPDEECELYNAMHWPLV
eukprot:TRINITY_DN1759_c0_g1_i1.p1 TRINITY_DN1759_c0_g1~~TRINITY_DN1759_c0_g1_i1.p1  ORF type:complete len:192 (-),score=48.66 TRINITY_DN1759_c0_g1_i1:27-602(-)